ncbi:MAG: CBS domain-containing protein, partial [Actinomycetes bacterium]
VRAGDEQEDVARLFQRYNLVSAPVVDDAGRLIGVVTIDDIVATVVSNSSAVLQVPTQQGSPRAVDAS